MAKSFTGREAKLLIEEHREIKARLERTQGLHRQYRSDISDAVKMVVEQETAALLKEVPIEEVNREKRGIRIRVLRERGYDTVADILGASARDIAAIRGISEESAHEIRMIVQQLADETGRNVKVRLNADHKTPAATYLIAALARYKQSLPYMERSRRLLAEYGKGIACAMEDLQPGTGLLNWMFASGKRKKKAEDGFAYLRGLLHGEYAFQAEEIQNAVYTIDHMLGREAWEDFQKDSIRYYKILEDIEPGILGTDDGVYGLPEELAKAVQEEPFCLEGLKCELRRYQEWGVKYILHQKRVLLGDEMGLGKTVQAIAAMVSLKNTGALHFMVVCPASVLSNWCRELKKHSTLSVVRIHGADRDASLEAWICTGGVAVTTYETTAFVELEDSFRFSMLVVDEAHYIKNPEAKRTRNVKAIGTHSERMLFMTGTALENRVEEMISLIEVLQPETAFAVRNMTFLSAAPQFREKIAPVYYRRRREDVLTELPELIENKEWCILMPREEAVYEEAVLARRYADARRVSWSVEDLQDSSKAKRMLEIIEDAEEDGRKVIVFSFFLDTIEKICSLLGEKCLSPINGSVPPERRQEIIDAFDRAPAGTVLAAQIQSGGTGLNIQSASVVIICEPQFKPSTENQAISRAYRMGQTRTVLVHRLLCDDTVDEKITDLLEEKQRIFDAFADESAAAESLELDNQTFGSIIQEEIDRIQAKNGETAPNMENRQEDSDESLIS